MTNAVAISSSRIPTAFSGFRIALCFARESVRIAPTYYVTGDHEAASPQYDTLKAGLEAAGVIVLEDETVYIERGGETISLLGLADPDLVAPNQGLFPKFDAGLYTDSSTSIVVSRGIGNSIMPFRFNNRPEIVLVELNAR